MLNKQQAISVLKKELPGMKPTKNFYIYKNWYVVEMIDKDQDPNDIYVDSFYKINRNTKEVSTYSPIVDADIDVYSARKI